MSSFPNISRFSSFCYGGSELNSSTTELRTESNLSQLKCNDLTLVYLFRKLHLRESIRKGQIGPYSLVLN